MTTQRPVIILEVDDATTRTRSLILALEAAGHLVVLGEPDTAPEPELIIDVRPPAPPSGSRVPAFLQHSPFPRRGRR